MTYGRKKRRVGFDHAHVDFKGLNRGNLQSGMPDIESILDKLSNKRELRIEAMPASVTTITIVECDGAMMANCQWQLSVTSPIQLSGLSRL